jgi:uncharacterized membrane protein
MEITIIIMLFLLILFIDVIAIFKKKNKKINIIYLVFYTITFIILMFDALGVNIPSPSMLIKNVIDSFMK